MRRLLLLCLVTLCLLGPRLGLAAPLEVRAGVGKLPVELLPQGGSYRAKLVVDNRGPEPKVVQVALREATGVDPRLPVGVTAKLAGAALINPGEQREIDVELTPTRGRRFHEFYGHVLVSTEGSAPVAAGFRAAIPGSDVFPSGQLLSLVWLVPLIGALVLALLRGREPRPGAGRALWVGAAAAQVGLLAWGVSRFDVFHTRFGGTEGVQLVERLSLLRGLGVEYHLGVDGTTLALALATSLFTLFAALLASESDAPRFGALALLVDAGLSGAFVALDLGLLVTFWLLVVVAVVLALRFWAGDARLATGTGIMLGLGWALVAFAVWQLSGTASAGYLMDGTPAPRVFSLTELAHGGFVPRAGALFGTHPIKAVYVCLFLGSALTLGVGPFGSWLGAVSTRAPAPLTLLLGGGVGMLGAHALWRIGFAALPSGAAWAAQGVAAFGVAATLYASLVALVTTDPRRFATLALTASGGAVLVGCAALTAAGLQGALVLTLSRGLVLAVVLGVLGMARAPDGSSLVGSIARGAPLLAALGAVGWLAAGLVPGTLAFLGAASGLFGALPTLRVLALTEVFALVVLAAAALRSYRRTFLGGGGGPRVAAALPAEREISVVLSAALVLLALGLWPRPLLRLVDAACLDQAAQVNPPGALEVVHAPESATVEQKLALRRALSDTPASSSR